MAQATSHRAKRGDRFRRGTERLPYPPSPNLCRITSCFAHPTQRAIDAADRMVGPEHDPPRQAPGRVQQLCRRIQVRAGCGIEHDAGPLDSMPDVHGARKEWQAPTKVRHDQRQPRRHVADDVQEGENLCGRRRVAAGEARSFRVARMDHDGHAKVVARGEEWGHHPPVSDVEALPIREQLPDPSETERSQARDLLDGCSAGGGVGGAKPAQAGSILGVQGVAHCGRCIVARDAHTVVAPTERQGISERDIASVHCPDQSCRARKTPRPRWVLQCEPRITRPVRLSRGNYVRVVDVSVTVMDTRAPHAASIRQPHAPVPSQRERGLGTLDWRSQRGPLTAQGPPTEAHATDHLTEEGGRSHCGVDVGGAAGGTLPSVQ